MSELPPADWYTDPEDPDQYRYWDGSDWTQHRAPRHRTVAGHRRVGALLTDTWTTVKLQWRPLLTICAVVVVVYLLAEQAVRVAYDDLFAETASALFEALENSDDGLDPTIGDRWDDVTDRLGGLDGSTLWSRALLLAAGAFVAVAINFVEFAAFGHFTLARLNNRPMGASAALLTGWRRVPRLIAATLMAVVVLVAVLMAAGAAFGIAIALVASNVGFTAVLVAAIAIIALLLVLAPLGLFTLMTAAAGPREPSMRYGRSLLKGSYRATLGRVVLMALFVAVTQTLLLFVEEFIGIFSQPTGRVVVVALSVLPEMLICIASFTLYHDLGGVASRQKARS